MYREADVKRLFEGLPMHRVLVERAARDYFVTAVMPSG
jgi:hypothetical protein